MRPNPPERTTPGTTAPGSEKFSPPMADPRGRPSLPARPSDREDRCAGHAGRRHRGVGQDPARRVLDRGRCRGPSSGLAEPRPDRRRTTGVLARRRCRADPRRGKACGRAASDRGGWGTHGGPPGDGRGRAPPCAAAGRARAGRSARDPLSPDPRRVAAARRTPAAGVLAAGHDASRSAVAAASPPLGGLGERRACGGSRLRAATRRRSSSRSSRSRWTPRVSSGWSTARKAGLRGFAWSPCTSAVRTTSRPPWPPSPGTTTAWRAISSPRCWIGRVLSSSPSSRRSASSIWCAPTSPTRSPAVATERRCSPSSQRRTSSSRPSASPAAGTGCTG